ncbi:MAG: class B sortase [Oscillospiraceae bacterium]
MANVRNKKKKKGGVLYVFAILILLGCLGILLNELYKYIQVRKTGEELKKVFYKDGSFSSESFKDLLEINSDTIGWLNVPGTQMDLVVVKRQSDSADGNTYYLEKDFFGETAQAGTLFMDYRNEVSKKAASDNLVIYGHNQADGTMMGELKNFKKLDFYTENPVFTFTTEFGQSDYKIFACFITDASESDDTRFDYQNYRNFESENVFNEFISEVMSRSFYTTSVDVKYGDEFITLSSCSTEFTDSRFVVMGRKVRSGESSDVDVSAAQKNTNIKYPDIWHELYG